MKKNNISVSMAKMLVATQFNIGEEISDRSRFLRNYNGSDDKEKNYEYQGSTLLKDNIVEIDGVYEKCHKEAKEIIIKTKNGKRVTVIPAKETVYSSSISESKEKNGRIILGDAISIIAIKTEESSKYVAVTVIRSEEKQIFNSVHSLYGKANAIKNFYGFFSDYPKKQEIIKDEIRQEKHKRYEAARDIAFDSLKELKLKYALTKENYPFEVQRSIELLINDPDPREHKIIQKLKYLINISPYCKNRIPIDKEKLQEELDKKFYKMDIVKQQIIDVLVSNERAKKRGFNILLVGPPGTGKTSIMEAISQIYNIPFEKISLGAMSHPQELGGLDSGFQSSKPGRFSTTFYAHQTSEMVIGLDEFNMINNLSNEGNPMDLFNDILTGKLKDKYLECEISTENTIFIATVNSLKDIPEAILNRFDSIIELKGYTTEEKITIAKKHLIPNNLDNFNLQEDSIAFSDSALRLIATHYCEDEGARDMNSNIEKIVRRLIREGIIKNKCVSNKDVKKILDPVVRETPAIVLNRNKEQYSSAIANEISQSLINIKINAHSKTHEFNEEKELERVSYLLACKNSKRQIKEFNPKKFKEIIHQDLYGMDNVIEQVVLFYHTAFLKGKLFNTNLALCGNYGIGKSAIVKNIAKALGYKYAKISLNEIDDVRTLTGFLRTYTGSLPGKIIKEIKKAGSMDIVFDLSEIDKLKPEIAIALIDLLDREFTDNYLGVPINLDNSIFVATANDWGSVPPVIRDRFMVVNVDGYSRDEKEKIVSDYIIPKLEKGYAASNVSISIEDNARTYLLRNYCPSFGVRDAEKAIQKLVSGKLADQDGMENAMSVTLNKEDIKKYLGKKPIARGNFPVDGHKPGISKALAVSGDNVGCTFAIETVLLNGEEGLSMTGLPKEMVTDSVKIAVTCIKDLYPNLLQNKKIHVHFGEGSVPKDGPSAGVALLMSILSAAIQKPLMLEKQYDIAYTGEISLTGGVFAVGGVYEKIQAACDSGCVKVFIPMQNYEQLDKEKLESFPCEIIPVTHISQVIKSVFPELKS